MFVFLRHGITPRILIENQVATQAWLALRIRYRAMSAQTSMKMMSIVVQAGGTIETANQLVPAASDMNNTDFILYFRHL